MSTASYLSVLCLACTVQLGARVAERLDPGRYRTLADPMLPGLGTSLVIEAA